MIDRIKQKLKEIDEDFQDRKFVLAVSAGIDSMVLLHCFDRLNLSFAIAHCNFNLRGSESEKETEFLLQHSKEKEYSIFVKHFDTEVYSDINKVSIQIAARELRYNWFEDIRKENQSDYIVTAHHLNDQIETYLINTVRATGVKGLSGIPMVNGVIVRPMLDISRNEIQDFAMINQIVWKDDSSNASTKYIRNKIRHQIVPVLEELHDDVYSNFVRLFTNLKEDQKLKELYLHELKNKFVTVDNENTYIKFEDVLAESSGFLKLKHLIRMYGFTDEIEISKFLDAESGKSIFTNDLEMLKNRSQLIIRKKTQLNPKEYEFFVGENLVTEDISLIFETDFLATIDYPINEIVVDLDKIGDFLKLRKTREGDYFHPFGMSGRKKVSKYFKDIKLSKFEKEDVWLLVNASDEIIWIVNHRFDDRFKIDEQTQKTIKIISK